MKVYEGSYPVKRNYKKVPEIKIKNKQLEKSGFKVGTDYKVIYSQNKILLIIKQGG